MCHVLWKILYLWRENMLGVILDKISEENVLVDDTWFPSSEFICINITPPWLSWIYSNSSLRKPKAWLKNKYLNTRVGHICICMYLGSLITSTSTVYVTVYHVVPEPAKTDLRQKDIPSFSWPFSMTLTSICFITVMV